MIKLVVKKTFSLPSSISFQEGEIFWGYYNYVCPLYRTQRGIVSNETDETNLCVIFCQERGARLLQKENFQIHEE